MQPPREQQSGQKREGHHQNYDDHVPLHVPVRFVQAATKDNGPNVLTVQQDWALEQQSVAFEG